MQNNLILVYNALGKDGEDTFPRMFKGERAVTREILPVPFLRDMAVSPHNLEVADKKDNMTPLNPKDDHPLSEAKYLIQSWKVFVRQLKRPTDPLYTVMSNCFLVIQRLRAIVDAPNAKVRSGLLCFRRRSGPYYRRWADNDFAFFRDPALVNGGWAKVLHIAYNLYRAQQCVFMWGNKTSYVYAIPLALWATIGVVGSIYPYTQPLIAELAAQYGTAPYTSAASFTALRRMIIAWSTTFPDAGVEVPPVMLPGRGLVGDGSSHWNGDARRGIPELEMCVVAIEPLANNWKAIYQARLRTRTEAMPFEEEFGMARKLFARNTPDLRSRSRSRPGQSKRALLLKQYEEERRAAENAEDESATPEPGSSNTAPSEDGWEIDDDPEVWFNRGPEIQTEAPNPDWYPTILRLNGSPTELPTPLAEMRNLEKRRKRDEIEALLQREDSSDEEDGWSSDDEVPPVLGLKGLGKEDYTGFGGFTIGPNGLVREKMDPPQEDYSMEDEKYSPMLFRDRSQSIGYDSISETERMLRPTPPPTNYRLPVLGRSTSPAVSISTLHSLGSAMPGLASVAMSRSSTASSATIQEDLPFPLVRCQKVDWAPKPSRPVADMDTAKKHIATLIRERDEYMPYFSSNERVTGRLVSRDIEEYISTWLEKEYTRGTVPRKITPVYLASIGLKDKDPLVDNIDCWILSQEWRWTPLECVLRAGISPKELPVWMVPHSKISVMRQLEHRRPLPAHVAIPDFPLIPDKMKSDPVTYREDIKAIRDEWEKEVSDGFPVFFPHHEKFPIGPDADSLFDDGELDSYLADQVEIDERQRDKEFMALLDGRDTGPGSAVDEEKKEKKRERRNAKIKGGQVSSEFRGYERAMEDELWAQTGLKEMDDGNEDGGDDESDDGGAEEEGEGREEEVVKVKKRKADGEGGAKKADDITAKKRKKSDKEVSSLKDPIADSTLGSPSKLEPLPAQIDTNTSIIDIGRAVSPTGPAQMGSNSTSTPPQAVPETLHAFLSFSTSTPPCAVRATQSAALPQTSALPANIRTESDDLSRAAALPSSTRLAGDQGRLPITPVNPTRSTQSRPPATANMLYLLNTPSPFGTPAPHQASSPRTFHPDTSTSATPTSSHPTRAEVQRSLLKENRAVDAATRRLRAADAAVGRIQLKWIEGKIKSLVERPNPSEETKKQLLALKKEKSDLEDKGYGPKKGQRKGDVDGAIVEAKVRAWAAERRIPLRDLGYGTAGIGVMQIQKAKKA